MVAAEGRALRVRIELQIVVVSPPAIVLQVARSVEHFATVEFVQLFILFNFAALCLQSSIQRIHLV